MAETLTPLNLEDLSPKERGQWLLSEAQKRLVVEKEREIEGIDIEPDSHFVHESRQAFKKTLQTQLERIQRSPDVVYQRRGRYELLKGTASGFGDIDVERLYGSNEGYSEWKLFGPFAKKRCKIAAEIASEVGFDVLGKDIGQRPRWEDEYHDSYDLPPRFELAPEPYQKKAADKMQNELAAEAAELSDDNFGAYGRLSEKFNAVSQSLALYYDAWPGAQELTGRMEEKPLHIRTDENSYRPEIDTFSGSWNGQNLDSQQSSDIWLRYVNVVVERQHRASDIWEHEKHILQELGVA